MFQLPGNLSGLGLQDCGGAGVIGGSRKQHGRRSGEGVRGDNGVSPPHPIHIRRQKQGKAPPCVVIRSLRSYYVRIIKVFRLKCMVP